MANPAEQFVPPGVDKARVEEIQNKIPTLKMVEGGKADTAERWSPKEFIDQDKWNPQELTGGANAPNTAEDVLKQREEDEKQIEALTKAIDTLEESEKVSGKAYPAEAQMQMPPTEKPKKMSEVGSLPPEPAMELTEEDIEEDLTPTNRIPEMANKPAIDYGDLQPGMEELPELSSEFLQEEDEEPPTIRRAA